MGWIPLRPFAALGALALAACAAVPPAVTGLPARAEIRDFGLEARFALRLERPYEPPESASGRLSWQHRAGSDHILVSNPLGQGVAEIEQNPEGARLRTSDGKIREAADAAALLQETTGYLLPLGELPAWLLGRPTASGRLETDVLGRPKRLADAGWQIEYDYDSEAAGALPARLNLQRGSSPELRSLELRLRIEEWRNAP
jgi:outer membrane lipoprotein LolB